MNLNWKTILKKAGIILLSTLLFALCSGLLYITKMAGSINITRPEDEPELASAMTNENLDTETRGKAGRILDYCCLWRGQPQRKTWKRK